MSYKTHIITILRSDLKLKKLKYEEIHARSEYCLEKHHTASNTEYGEAYLLTYEECLTELADLSISIVSVKQALKRLHLFQPLT